MEEKSVMLWMMMMKCFGAESASEVPSQKVKYHLPTLQGPYVNTFTFSFHFVPVPDMHENPAFDLRATLTMGNKTHYTLELKECSSMIII